MSYVFTWLEDRLGVELFDYQRDFLDAISVQASTQLRTCLYYRTGAGKTLTALAGMLHLGYTDVLVIAPPVTHPAWQAWGSKSGVTVETISHAKFRQPDYKLDRQRAVIADEFHLFGGHNSVGWKKLERAARGLQAPLTIMSATPNYNDAERVYCVKKILHPQDCTGGFLQFLYDNCTTKQNPFSITPDVLGFANGRSAVEVLSSMKNVFYVPDEATWSEIPVDLPYFVSSNMENYNYSVRRHRIMASQMERRHEILRYTYLSADGGLKIKARRAFNSAMPVGHDVPVLVFANHATIATALYEYLEGLGRVGLITGKTSHKEKARLVEDFRAGALRILIGTASLATGTDGLDKVCDHLIIFQDTDDDSLRRQLIGRILPRGADSSSRPKYVYRFFNE